MIRILLLLCFSSLYCQEPTVFLTSLIRDQAHLLPKYLQTIENLDYDKSLITVHFTTYNNSDETLSHLYRWKSEHKNDYKTIEIEDLKISHIKKKLNYEKREFSSEENKVIKILKNRGLEKAKEHSYYFYLDPTALIAPFTLKELIDQDKPMIAPLLKCIPECDDHTSTFFSKITERGYYEHDENYIKILFKWSLGTFQVPLIRDALLIKNEFLEQLSYTDDTDDYDFIILSRMARKNNIEQYLINEKEYGVKIHFFKPLSREEEHRKLKNILLIP